MKQAANLLFSNGFSSFQFYEEEIDSQNVEWIVVDVMQLSLLLSKLKVFST